jgi:hypothetical protein
LEKTETVAIANTFDATLFRDTRRMLLPEGDDSAAIPSPTAKAMGHPSRKVLQRCCPKAADPLT